VSFNSLLKDTCTFQLNTPAQNATSGQWEDSWANVALLTALKCRLEPIGGGLMGTPTKVYEDATHTLFLRKYATAITTKDHRVVISGNTYTILLVQDLSDDKESHHLELVLSLVT